MIVLCTNESIVASQVPHPKPEVRIAVAKAFLADLTPLRALGIKFREERRADKWWEISQRYQLHLVAWSHNGELREANRFHNAAEDRLIELLIAQGYPRPASHPAAQGITA